MQPVTSFRSDRGHIFDKAIDAVTDDLVGMLTTDAGNEPIAKKLAAAIIGNLDAYGDVLDMLRSQRPVVEPELPYSEMKLYDSSGREVPVPTFAEFSTAPSLEPFKLRVQTVDGSFYEIDGRRPGEYIDHRGVPR